MSTLFVADLHLHTSRPATIDCFLAFLRQQQGQAETLYILGDLFESWIGDDHSDPAYEAVKSSLKSCINAGTAIYLMHGNRDFLIGTQFATQTGCRLVPDPIRINLVKWMVYLAHFLCT